MMKCCCENSHPLIFFLITHHLALCKLDVVHSSTASLPPSSRKVLGTTGLVGKLLRSLFTRHPRALCFTLKLHVSPDDCIAACVLDGCILTWATSGTLILLKEQSVHFRFVEIIAAFMIVVITFQKTLCVCVPVFIPYYSLCIPCECKPSSASEKNMTPQGHLLLSHLQAEQQRITRGTHTHTVTHSCI